jgi:Coenzyme PQQ synthesis protein D (PqqD)
MTPPLSLDSRIVATSDHLASELSGEVVILSLADGVYYGLDAVGAFVWHQLRDPRTVRDLVDDVMERYATERISCERDLLAFLQDLLVHHLAEVVPDDSA